MIPWIERGQPFPPPARALRQPNGLLCAGADLSVARLLDAYRQGIFPWYAQNEPILWWSPDPRMVLFVAELRVSRSLAKSARNRGYTVRVDSAFDDVLRGCAAPREGAGGTWLVDEMQAAYRALHRAGHAHSIETWCDGVLVGGLYGVAIGRMFYGESMFARATDASKVALLALCDRLARHRMPMIDCQVPTRLLTSLGAREIPRAVFLRQVASLVNYKHDLRVWRSPTDAAVRTPATQT